LGFETLSVPPLLSTASDVGLEELEEEPKSIFKNLLMLAQNTTSPKPKQSLLGTFSLSVEGVQLAQQISSIGHPAGRPHLLKRKAMHKM